MKLLDHSLELRDLKRADVLPGEVKTTKLEFLIPIKEDFAKLWRMAISKTYKDIVIEPREKRNLTERRFSVIERMNSIAEALGSKQDWKEVLEKLRNSLDGGSNYGLNKKRVSIVYKTSYTCVQVTTSEFAELILQ